ncbi:MAG: hypothetical protein H6712_09500 [Myxococcales bacterium]|nr:hypothetical protein [Myxococcales bacterium]MCB9714078.1 hypothetical protein [Myxococcales bacterium]
MRLLDELRSLARPSGPSPAPHLRVGDPAPVLRDEPPAGPAVVVFLRHVGCPFAELTVQQLRRVTEEQPSIAWWLVSMGSIAATEAWLAEVGRPRGIELLSDPSLATHARWGLGADSVRHFLRPRTLLGALAAWRDGARNRDPEGSRWQQAGAFAIDEGGRLAWVHHPRSAEDLPDLRAAAAAVRS